MHNWDITTANKLAKIDNIRYRETKTANTNRLLICKDQTHINFISNDYLGLSTEQCLINAVIPAIEKYGIGSTGAPTLTGHTLEHENLELQLAKWLNFPRCLLFNSGYQLNIGIYKQLINDNTIIWSDKNCHASHIDGISLSKGKVRIFTAASIDNVINTIKTLNDNLHIIVTEGIFSMDGICSYLDKLLQLRSQYPNILLIVDDAHGIGTLGHNGFGTLEHLGLSLKLVDLYIGTLSKSFASHGGFICGNSTLINYLQQTTRSQLFSSALPPLLAAASNASLNIIKSNHGLNLRHAITCNINYFIDLCLEYELPIYNADFNQSPIQVLIFKDKKPVEYIFQQLLQKKIRVGRMLYPTVAKNEPRLRISLSAKHTSTDIKLLCQTMADAICHMS